MALVNKPKTGMHKYTDKELVKIVTVEVHKFEPEQVKAAESELAKRKISKLKMAELVKAATLDNSAALNIQSYVTTTGIRFVNFIIDFFAFVILAILGSLLLDSIFTTSDTQLLLTTGYGLIFVIFMLYYGVSEFVFQKTLGKYFTKTKVVTNEGEKPGIITILIRTLCRLIPFDRLSFLIFKKGFHDKLSETQVIKDA